MSILVIRTDTDGSMFRDEYRYPAVDDMEQILANIRAAVNTTSVARIEIITEEAALLCRTIGGHNFPSRPPTAQPRGTTESCSVCGTIREHQNDEDSLRYRFRYSPGFTSS